jgi:hypothetical protein
MLSLRARMVPLEIQIEEEQWHAGDGVVPPQHQER